MAAAESAHEFLERVQENLPQLSKQHRRIASCLLDSPQSLGWLGIVDFAELCGVPPSCVVRFAQRFGYSGFSPLKHLFREALRQQLVGLSPHTAMMMGQRSGLIDGVS